MTTKSDAEWIDRLQSPAAREAARGVMTAGDAVRKASAEARARSETPDRQQDAEVLATHLAPVLMELAAETLLDAETDGGRAAVREWVRETLAGTGEDAVVELHDVLGELIAPTRRRRERREHAVLRIAERMLPGAEAEREAAAGRRVSEHTVVIGGNAAERGAVLAETIAEMEGDPDRIATVRLNGRSLGGGAFAMWGAAAEQLCEPAGNEVPNPLNRLLEHDENRRIGICIDDIDAMIERWDDRNEVWTLRRILQSEGRIVLAGTAERWPPAGTTGVDSGTYGSFATTDLG